MLSDIKKHLPKHPWRDQIQYFDTLDSTNTYAKLLAQQGAAEGTVIIADQQTGGRGRLGRSFSSPAGMGIYMSVILRPDCRPEELMHLTCAAGLAACNAIENTLGIFPGIKWTNDLVLNRKKLGGILTELSVDPASGNVEWAVVGIGINCCQKAGQFPPEIQDIACSLGLEPGQTSPLSASLIVALETMSRTLLAEKNNIMGAFSQRCITVGSEISILRGDEVQHATAIGIAENGGLLVQYPNGKKDIITSGEVSIRGMYGYL